MPWSVATRQGQPIALSAWIMARNSPGWSCPPGSAPRPLATSVPGGQRVGFPDPRWRGHRRAARMAIQRGSRGDLSLGRGKYRGEAGDKHSRHLCGAGAKQRTNPEHACVGGLRNPAGVVTRSRLEHSWSGSTLYGATVKFWAMSCGRVPARQPAEGGGRPRTLGLLEQRQCALQQQFRGEFGRRRRVGERDGRMPPRSSRRWCEPKPVVSGAILVAGVPASLGGQNQLLVRMIGIGPRWPRRYGIVAVSETRVRLPARRAAGVVVAPKLPVVTLRRGGVRARRGCVDQGWTWDRCSGRTSAVRRPKGSQ
jgi:hypothetical protein